MAIYNKFRPLTLTYKEQIKKMTLHHLYYIKKTQVKKDKIKRMNKEERYNELLKTRDQIQKEVDKLDSWTVENKFGTPTPHPLFDMLLKINRQLLQYEKEVSAKGDNDKDPFEEI